MQLTSVTATPSLTQSTQNLTISFVVPVNTFSTARGLYVLLPAGYAMWNSRGSTVTIPINCSVVNTASSATELAQTCTWISRRVLKIQMAVSTTGTNFRVWVAGVVAPISVLEEFRDSLEVNVYLTADSSELAVSRYSFQKLFSPISLLGNPVTTDL